MNIFEAVANWYGCPYGLKKCRYDCETFMMVNTRNESARGVGPPIARGERNLCDLLEDLDQQVMKKTNDPRLIL